MLKASLILTLACVGVVASAPVPLATANPKNLSVFAARATENNIKVVLVYQLPGNPDSALTRLTQVQPAVNRAHRLPSSILRDSFLLTRPAIGVTVNGIACVQSKRRGLLSPEICGPWSYTEADVAPPPPILDTIRPDTSSLRIAGLDLKPDNFTLAPGEGTCLCVFTVFGDGQVAMPAGDAAGCAGHYTSSWPSAKRQPSLAQQQISDTLTVLIQEAGSGGTVQAGTCSP